MATFNSVLQHEIDTVELYTKSYPALDSGFVDLPEHAYNRTLSSAYKGFFNQRFSTLHMQTSQSFFWEGNTHLIPRTLDFGSNQNLTLTFDIICVQRAGATVSMSLAAFSPLVFTPAISSQAMTFYEIQSVDVTIDLSSGFTGSFIHVVPTTGAANPAYISISGEVAARILQFRPDANSAREVWQYLTDVMQRIDGREQRFALRENPRTTLTYEISTIGNETSRVHTLMAAIYKQIILAPLWFVFNLTTTAMTSATRSTIFVSTADLPIAIGQQILIWESDTQYAVREISGISATQITVASPFQYDFPQKSLVVPTTNAIMSDMSAQLYNPEDNYAKFTAQMLVEEMPTQTYTNNYPTYNSDFVFTETNITRADVYISGSMERRSYSFLSETARYVSEIDTNARLSLIIPFTVLCNSRAELINMRRFVQALRGSLRTFYITSGKYDLDYVSSSSQSVITCTSIQYVNDQNFVRNQLRHLEFEFANGTIERREITAVSTNVTANTETFTLSSALTQTLSATTVSRISFLYYVRISDDTITFDYVNPTTTFVSFNLITIKEEN